VRKLLAAIVVTACGNTHHDDPPVRPPDPPAAVDAAPGPRMLAWRTVAANPDASRYELESACREAAREVGHLDDCALIDLGEQIDHAEKLHSNPLYIDVDDDPQAECALVRALGGRADRVPRRYEATVRAAIATCKR
jgi:hypothetical protein